jgi:hypothetical protein
MGTKLFAVFTSYLRALAQALDSFPAFNKNKPALECTLNFEQLLMQHEEAGSTYDPSQTSPGGDSHPLVSTNQRESKNCNFESVTVLQGLALAIRC